MSVPLGSVNRLVPGLIERVEGLRDTEQEAGGPKPGNFGELLSNLIESVNGLHHESTRLQDAFLAGEPVELHQVMIKVEEAGLATELLLEIRNRIVSAYNELLRMPL